MKGWILLPFFVAIFTGRHVCAQEAEGCTGTPCLRPSLSQSSALFNRIEALYPQIFFPSARTQINQTGSDLAWFRVYGTSGRVGLATYQGGLWYKNNSTQWQRFDSLDQSDFQFCMSLCLARELDTAAFTGSIVLGAPTSSSVRLSLFSSEQSGIAMVRYADAASRSFTESAPVFISVNEPATITLTGLKADTAYRYSIVFKVAGASTGIVGPEHGFQTARPLGKSFTFTIQADSHMDENSVVRMYHLTLGNILAAQPDFHIDLGDTFMTEKHYHPLLATSPPAASLQEVVDRYIYERKNFSLIAADVPIFLANGNHEGEAGWLNTGGADNIANWSSITRQRFFPTPQADGFYSAESGSKSRGSYYAWQWGDALFLVLDPYWNSTKAKGSDAWSMTLGFTQYKWLETTLANSTATFKFVFLHSLVGGLDGQMRGGIEAARLFEWGGYNSDGFTRTFESRRPGWSAPIHELLVRYGVSAVFHGHDHLYVHQKLDGVVYQEVPQPSALNTNNAAALARDYHYNSGVALSSAGHLRVTVTPDQVTASYIRTWLPEQENSQRKNGQVDHSWIINRGY